MDKESALSITEDPPPMRPSEALILKLNERGACIQVVDNEDIPAFSRVVSAITGILRANHKETDRRIRRLLAGKNRPHAKHKLAVDVLMEIYDFSRPAAEKLYRDTLEFRKKIQEKRKRARRHKKKARRFRNWTTTQSPRPVDLYYSQRPDWWDK